MTSSDSRRDDPEEVALRHTTICAMDQQVRRALLADTVLATLGFDHRHLGRCQAPRHLAIEPTWSSDWRYSRTGMLGRLDIEITGVSDRTRSAVLDRVDAVLAPFPAIDGPIRRVRRVGSASSEFLVLGQCGSESDRVAGRRD